LLDLCDHPALVVPDTVSSVEDLLGHSDVSALAHHGGLIGSERHDDARPHAEGYVTELTNRHRLAVNIVVSLNVPHVGGVVTDLDALKGAEGVRTTVDVERAPRRGEDGHQGQHGQKTSCAHGDGTSQCQVCLYIYYTILHFLSMC